MDYDNWLVDPWEQMEAKARLEDDIEARAIALLHTGDGFVTALAQTALAPYQAALTALEAGDLAQARRLLLPAARACARRAAQEVVL